MANEKNVAITPKMLLRVASTSHEYSVQKRRGILSSNYETTSYIKNIVITDDKGYTCEGILNSATNEFENSFEINR